MPCVGGGGKIKRARCRSTSMSRDERPFRENIEESGAGRSFEELESE